MKGKERSRGEPEKREGRGREENGNDSMLWFALEYPQRLTG